MLTICGVDFLLIKCITDETEQNTGPGFPRKAYVLTEIGRWVLGAETNRLQALVSAARLRLGEESI